MTVDVRPVSPHRLLPPTRYRHPGDVIRLVAAGALLGCSLLVAPWLSGPDAYYVTGLGGDAARVITGAAQVIVLASAVLAMVAALVLRRYRLMLGLLLAGGVAAGATYGLLALVGARHPEGVDAQLAADSWVMSAQFPGPPVLAGATAAVTVGSRWLSRAWCRAAWLLLAVVLVARLVPGAILPIELIIAVACGLTVGFAVLVALGVPDRRIGPDGIARALRRTGLDVIAVDHAPVVSKGARPFVAVTADGRRLFVKALGSQQRDADLMYRAYRGLRLRDVGDTRPAASLFAAVEHQALVGVLAQRAGVDVPAVDRVVRADDENALLVMEWVEGRALEALGPDDLGDDLLAQVWGEVGTLHAARIAHRSLRSANIMVTADGAPCVVDFSFSALDASQRQLDLDVAELLASLAAQVGEERAVSGAMQALGPQSVGSAVPLLQPLALSAATRRAVAAQEGLLKRTRSAAAAASGHPDEDLARLQRVRPRTLLMVVALSAAFYVLLPQLAQVQSSWQALQSAQWVWLPVVIGFSVLTYLASAIALLGGVSTKPPFWPTAVAQGASSFVNRVSPSNVGGMALNVRYLQKNGVPAGAGVAAVGLNSFAGAIVHLILLVTFLAWAGQDVSNAFQLPSSSKILMVLAVVAAVIGIVLATRPGRRFAAKKIVPGIKSSFADLRQVARSPVKLAMLFGGSACVTLAYIGGLVASAAAFGAGATAAQIGAIYLLASVIAAASPTPGGLGAIEAALVAGLTGLGISAGVAVSAVLTYRLATYWLPVVPGWLCLRALQRWDYV